MKKLLWIAYFAILTLAFGLFLKGSYGLSIVSSFVAIVCQKHNYDLKLKQTQTQEVGK